ncbi:MAG: hypothetical protein J6W00_11105 [Lentisphaeria bacterium]|nr:hypothetical protein [Lentisphaeria bacterium]
MTDKLQKIFRKDSGCFQYGFIRPGITGISAVCIALDAPGTRQLKNGRKVQAGIVETFFVKRYKLSGIFNQLRSYFKFPRPFKVLQGTEKITASGIETPEVYAALILWKNFYRKDYLVTSLLDEKNFFLNQMLKNGQSDEVWQLLLTGFIPALAKLHDSGVIHGDLSMRNLYLSSSGNVGMIDLDGVKIFSAPVKNKYREMEIARLISSFFMSMPRDPEKCGKEVAVPEEYVVAALEYYPHKQNLNNVQKKIEKFIRRGKKYL